MGIDYGGLAFPKGELRVERKRQKRLTDEQSERDARAAVRKRDGARCTVPGCREAGVHLHHIVRRSRSRRLRWATGNLCFLCVAHHAMEHAGRIHISGDANVHLDITGDTEALRFRL